MSLHNLLKIGQLKPHPPDAAAVQRLLAAAERLLQDVTAWLKAHRPQLLVPPR